MTTVNIHEAKTHLSRLLEAVAKGETVIIAKAGKPVAKLTAVEETPKAGERRLDFLRGKIQIPDDFDADNEEIADLFEGRE